MGDSLNAAQLDRFNAFVDEHYRGILAEVTESIRRVPCAERAQTSRRLTGSGARSKTMVIRSAGSTE